MNAAAHYRRPALLALLVLTVFLNACAIHDERVLFGGSSSSFDGPTLEDVKRNRLRINISPRALDKVEIEEVIDSYREALALISTSEQRINALRRMADLMMVASEDRLIAGDDIDDTPAVEEVLDELEDERTELEKQRDEERVDYVAATRAYEELIANAEPDTHLAEPFYLLSKAYDLSGENEKSRDILTRLVSEYPDSPFHAEAQFRRGELLFLYKDYNASAAAYADVLESENNEVYIQPAKYKLGWSLYLLGDYDLAINQFIGLLDAHLLPTEDGKVIPVTRSVQKILNDAYRAAALSFLNLDGADSVVEFFESHGMRDYEYDIYRSLTDLYLQQERFLDAAHTFQTFIGIHPLNPNSPGMASAIISTYRKGGFPSLILPAKEQFVVQYGISSDYWDNASAENLALYKPELKLHLMELAQHYHAMAQQENTIELYDVATRWYRELMQTFPSDANIAEFNQYLGETLLASQRFRDAVVEFERTAYEYPEYEQRGRAGYLALLAYQSELQLMSPDATDRQTWIQKKVDSSLKFVDNFADSKFIAAVLDNIVEDQLTLGDLKAAIATSEIIINKQPPLPEALLQKAWITKANGLFDLGEYAAAEQATNQVLAFGALPNEQRAKFQQQQAQSIYKQAEALRAENKLDEAANEFLRLGALLPDSATRAVAEYDAATLLLEQEKWTAAINVLEQFRRLYPRHKLLKTLPAKLAIAYENTERWPEAAREYLNIADANKRTEPELARQSLWQAAEYTEKAELFEDAIALYKDYVWGYEQPYALRTEGQHRLTKLYEASGDNKKRDFWHQKIVDGYEANQADAGSREKYLAAASAFHLAEPVYKKYEQITLKLPLKKTLKRKRAAMKRALDTYKNVARYGVQEFTTASTFKIGEIYRLLSVSLMQSQRPKGLDEFALEEYEILLEEQALPFEDQAIEILETNAKRTTEGVYDPWIRKSFEALSKLNPGRFDKQEQVDISVDAIY